VVDAVEGSAEWGGAGRPSSYAALLRVPGARAFVSAGFLGRLPMSMLGLGVVVLISDIRHSYALAGAVSATLTCAGALGSPALGTLADRIGQRTTLKAAVPHVIALVVLCALILRHAPLWTLFPAAAVTGALLPPVSSMLRARWTFLLGGGTPAVERAYALEAILDELVFIAGPVLVTTLGGAIAPVSGMVCSGIFVLVGCLLLAAQHRTEPPLHTLTTRRRGVLRIAGVRVLVSCCAIIALAFGTIDVGMVAFATDNGRPALSGLLLACVAAGSGSSAIWYGRRAWRAPLHRRFLIGCGVLVLSTLPLTLASSLGAMVPLGFVAGSAISPVLIAGFSLVERLVPRAMLTEGFTWVSTALGFGVGIGVTVGGRAIDAIGASRAFLLCPTAALVGGLIGVAGLSALRRRPPAADLT
jgi:MFS family permease